MAIEHIQKKLREARKEIRELKEEKAKSDRVRLYLMSVLYRYDEASWNFNENRLHEVLVVLRGIFVGDW